MAHNEDCRYCQVAESEILSSLRGVPLVFFWDPLAPHPHDPDVKALLRIAVVWNVPVACNRASADFMFSSPLMTREYERRVPDYQVYKEREIAQE